MLSKIPEPRARIFGVSPDRLWMGEGDYCVKAWDVRDGSMVQSYRCSDFPANLDVSTRGNMLGVGNYGRSQVVPLDLSHVRD